MGKEPPKACHCDVRPYRRSQQRDLDLGSDYPERIPAHASCTGLGGGQRTFGRGVGVYMLERISLGMVENYVYWCISNLSDSPGDQIRYSSLLRGIETAGVAVGFGVQA